VKVFEYYQDEAYFYIVEELFQGDDLLTRLEKEGFFDEAAAANVLRQVLSAISYCHQHDVVHR